MQIQTTAEDHRIAWLTALAITIHIMESAIPAPLPGIKPGLANVITIAVLIQFGWRTAAWVSLLRVVCGGLLLGTFLTPTFLLSLAGASCSLLVLWFATRLPGEGFGAARSRRGLSSGSMRAETGPNDRDPPVRSNARSS